MFSPGKRLERALRCLRDESEFLLPHGVRSLSSTYKDRPYVFRADGDDHEYSVAYAPGDTDTQNFGGNSNWRGPVWLPNLSKVAHELAERLGSLFVPQEGRPRPCHGSFARYADDPHWRDHVLFYEYFDGDTGRGLGASHQTGWTSLVGCLLEDCAHNRGKDAVATRPESRGTA